MIKYDIIQVLECDLCGGKVTAAGEPSVIVDKVLALINSSNTQDIALKMGWTFLIREHKKLCICKECSKAIQEANEQI